MNIQTTARVFAASAHAGQTYGAEPYTAHLEAVVSIVQGVDISPEATAVAYLHDALEDTSATAVVLAMLFGASVATAVALVTDPEGENRRTRKEALHARLSGLDSGVRTMRLALLVKAADRLANVRASSAGHPVKLRMYRREHTVFRAAAHRSGVCDAVWMELDSLLEGVA